MTNQHDSSVSRNCTIGERLSLYGKLIRIDRPIGILLLLWPAMWALWIAGEGNPDWHLVVIFSLGVFLMRSAGCAINDYADRDFDGHVERTKQRPIAAGLIEPKEALWVFVVLCLTAFALVLLLDWKTVAMSFVAAFLAGIYPFMKRYTHLPQVVLGAAFGWAVPMAFMAQTGSVPPVAWLLFAATVIWVVIYDTQYAMVDREDDLKIGVKSTAILFGRFDLLIISLLQAVMLGMLLVVGIWIEAKGAYLLGLVAALGLFMYQLRIIRSRDPAACFTAFLNNNYFGMAIFIGLVLDYMSRQGNL
ncbi:MAG: 4-hydroxybenzoate octaprenyltransferase [Candidatus Polarisedimenticolaceae bacterium]|nr:4-hydroxybenzoate octaprenyltransferase [Candidatus Polarisedimenticolaceae bacterium]